MPQPKGRRLNGGTVKPVLAAANTQQQGNAPLKKSNGKMSGKGDPLTTGKGLRGPAHDPSQSWSAAWGRAAVHQLRVYLLTDSTT